MPPNAPSCSVYAEDWNSVMWAATSYHPGGVNAVFLDGSVRFISETIDTGNLALPPVSSGPSPYGVWARWVPRTAAKPQLAISSLQDIGRPCTSIRNRVLVPAALSWSGTLGDVVGGSSCAAGFGFLCWQGFAFALAVVAVADSKDSPKSPERSLIKARRWKAPPYRSAPRVKDARASGRTDASGKFSLTTLNPDDGTAPGNTKSLSQRSKSRPSRPDHR